MLRVAVALALVAVCYAQTVPKISETFSSAGVLEYHDPRGTFFGSFIIDRDQSKNMGVENATYQVGPFSEHYEFLELYNTGDRYTIRYNGSGEEHCQLEKVNGSLPEYWGWVSLAKYGGTFTFHEVEYDVWLYYAGGVEYQLLVPMDDPNTPRFFRCLMGPVIMGFEFRAFSSSEPSVKDFDVPKSCTSSVRRIPMTRLNSSL